MGPARVGLLKKYQMETPEAGVKMSDYLRQSTCYAIMTMENGK